MSAARDISTGIPSVTRLSRRPHGTNLSRADRLFNNKKAIKMYKFDIFLPFGFGPNNKLLLNDGIKSAV
jgi:hypothetical protein